MQVFFKFIVTEFKTKKSTADHVNRIMRKSVTFFSVIVTSILYLFEKK